MRAGRMRCLVALAVVVAAACSGTAPSAALISPTPEATTAPRTAASVTYKDFQVDPTTLEVKVGTKVTWTNRDGTTHTATSGVPGAKSGVFEHPIPAGGTATVAFDKTGTFEFFCEFHVTMLGRIVVK